MFQQRRLNHWTVESAVSTVRPAVFSAFSVLSVPVSPSIHRMGPFKTLSFAFSGLPDMLGLLQPPRSMMHFVLIWRVV